MADRIAGFDWDRGNRAKCQRHGVSVAEIESVFERSPAVRFDPAHSGSEARHLAIGRGASGRWIFLAFTYSEAWRRDLHPSDQRAVHARKRGSTI